MGGANNFVEPSVKAQSTPRESEITQKPADDQLVSVVIASYNTEKYLGQSIESVLNQSYQNLELIVVDDGSTDATSELIEPYRSDSRLRYVYQDNAGQSNARNQGVRLAKGDLIAFNDADDIWYPSKLEKQVPVMARSENVALVYTGRDRIDSEGNPIEHRLPTQYRGANLCERLFERNFVPCNTCLIRKAVFERLGGFNEQLERSEDWDLWLRLAAEYEIDFVPDRLAAKRFWPNQISRDMRRVATARQQIVRSFWKSHPNSVSRQIVDHAHAMNERMLAHAEVDQGNRLSALKILMSALKHDPFNPQTYKCLVKLGLGRTDFSH